MIGGLVLYISHFGIARRLLESINLDKPIDIVLDRIARASSLPGRAFTEVASTCFRPHSHTNSKIVVFLGRWP